ncbi:MAG: copper amine oxidase N-terminal domain-containing protein [Bacillota bacterium]|nr:copper amine oxidase N-terminal domain-containing protein [Bacillota bacterium]
MKKRMLSFLLCFSMCTALIPMTASAAATNINVSEVTYYEDNGDLEGLTIDFGWDTASAPSRLTVMTKKLRSAGEVGTNKTYGDFTNLGYYGKSFQSWNDVLDNSDAFGMLYYADEQKMSMGKTNTISVTFEEGDIPLDVNETYYVYLWTYYGGHYYPDNLFMVLQVKNDKLQYAPATGRNSYGSFTTLWELEDAPAETPKKNTETPKESTSSTNKPAVSSSIHVNVEGKDVVWTDAVPFIKDGRTLVPLRPIANALGLAVVWDAELQQAGFSDGETTVVFELNSKEYVVFHDETLNNADVVKMDTSAISVNGRTYAPAKYLAQAFGYNVGWNGNTSTVTISKGKVETVIPEAKPAAANVKTDPLPPTDISKQADWYLKLTPAYQMTNAQLVKEIENMRNYLDSHTKTDSTQIRLYDLQGELTTRAGALDSYATYAKAFGKAKADADYKNDKGLKRAMASDIAPLMDSVSYRAYFGY